MKWINDVKASGIAFRRWACSVLVLAAINTFLLLLIAIELFLLCARSV